MRCHKRDALYLAVQIGLWIGLTIALNSRSNGARLRAWVQGHGVKDQHTMRGKPDAMLAARLRELKDFRNLSYQQLGNAIGVSKVSVFEYLHATIRIPADRLPHLVNALDCTVGDLFMPPGSPLPQQRRAPLMRLVI